MMDSFFIQYFINFPQNPLIKLNQGLVCRKNKY
jgi:hypothetical protein